MRILAPERTPVLHEIVIRRSGRYGHALSVSCTCLRIPRGGRSGHAVIAARPLFPAPEALAAWRAWHEREGIPL